MTRGIPGLRLPLSRIAGPACVGAVTAALWLRFNAAPGRDAVVFAYDFLHYFLPMTELAVRRLGAGELPLWNPHSCSGIPLLATMQVGAFYPGTWLALWLPAERALAWRALLECALAGLFALAWFRSWGNGAYAASCGGVLFVFACVLGQIFWPPSVSCLVWLPALLLCVEKLVVRWRWRWWCAAVACVGLQILAGYPQYLVYSAYLVAPYALVRLASRRAGGASPRATLGTAAGLAAAAAIGAGLAGIQLLPTLELVQESRRGAALSPAAIHHGTLEPGVTMGDVLRNALDPRPKLISAGFGPGAGYLGIPTLLALALGTVAAWRQARTWVFAAVGATAFLLAPGHREWTAPLYELYASLPTGSMFRDPQRLRWLAFFCAIALAVPGFAEVARGGAGLRGRPAARRSAIAAVVAVALVAALLGGEGAAWRAAAALGLMGGALLAGPRPALRRTCATGLLALLAADLWHATGPGFAPLRDPPTRWARTLHANSRVFVDEARFEQLRRAAGFGRLAFPNLTPSLGVGPLAGGYRVSCLEPLVPAAWSRLDGLLGRRSEAVQTLAFLTLPAAAAFYDLAGVRTVAFAERRGGGDARLRVLDNDDALPRAYVVEGFALRAPADALAAVARAGVNFRRTVVLERDPALAQGPAPFYRPAEIVAYAPERVEVEAEAVRESLLVLSDSHYPGWRARLLGPADRELEILRANGLYRAVRIPAGRHRVVFEYRPASLRIGAALSVGSALLALGLPLAARRAERP